MVKILGHIGSRSTAVVPGLLEFLQDENANDVRLEAIRSLGKIGEGAVAAIRALAQVLKRADREDLRGDAALALARIAPTSGAATAALRAALDDSSGWVCVCAAAALWKVSRKVDEVVPALASRLTDPHSRDAAAQALYRIGADARGAVPALLAAAKKNGDRLFHESVVLALRKIDPSRGGEGGANLDLAVNPRLPSGLVLQWSFVSVSLTGFTPPIRASGLFSLESVDGKEAVRRQPDLPGDRQ